MAVQDLDTEVSAHKTQSARAEIAVSTCRNRRVRLETVAALETVGRECCIQAIQRLFDLHTRSCQIPALEALGGLAKEDTVGEEDLGLKLQQVVKLFWRETKISEVEPLEVSSCDWRELHARVFGSKEVQDQLLVIVDGLDASVQPCSTFAVSQLTGLEADWIARGSLSGLKAFLETCAQLWVAHDDVAKLCTSQIEAL